MLDTSPCAKGIARYISQYCKEMSCTDNNHAFSFAFILEYKRQMTAISTQWMLNIFFGKSIPEYKPNNNFEHSMLSLTSIVHILFLNTNMSVACKRSLLNTGMEALVTHFKHIHPHPECRQSSPTDL
jgi:hypothetical protein